MFVYRICYEEEVRKILDIKSFECIGKTFIENEKLNDFKYIPNTLYMHFFLNLISILHMSTVQDRCICTYDIPEPILDQHSGNGKYLDFISFSTLYTIKEYAIPSDIIKFEYLNNIDRLTRNVDFEEVLGDGWEKCIQKIYQR